MNQDLNQTPAYIEHHKTPLINWRPHSRTILTIVLAGFVATFVTALAAPSIKQTTTKARVIALNGKLLSNMDRYNSATDPAEKAKFLNEAVAISQERKNLMNQLVAKEPSNANEASLPPSISQNLPAPVKTNVEKQLVAEGDLVTLHSDNFQANQANYLYALNSTNGKRYHLHFSGKQPDIYATRSKIHVSGVELNNEVAVAANGSTQQAVQSLQSANTPGAKKAVVIMFNFSNNQSQPYTADQLRSKVFGSSNSVAAYFRETSYGKQDLVGKNSAAGDVLGWYTIPNSSGGCDLNSLDAWTTAANNAAKAAGADLSGYNNFIYFFPNTYSCAWAGLSEMPGQHSWINGYLDLRIFAHELGHTYGAHHANKLSCYGSSGQRVAISSNCYTYEYGDPYDVMGSAAYHFNNFHKGQVGFLDTSGTTTVTTSGTYTLSPEETPGGTKAIKLPAGTYNYYLEYRQPFGFDNFSTTSPVVNGVSVRLASDYNASPITQSQLIDASPDGNYNDSAIGLNKSFNDPDKKITVTVTALTSTTATVNISYNLPPPTPPPGGSDTIPPTAPTNFRVSTHVTGQYEPANCVVQMNWDASTDNVKVYKYNVYRDGVYAGGTYSVLYNGQEINNNWLDCPTSSGTYTYYVTAKDQAGNESAPSNSAIYTYNAGNPQPPPPPPTDRTAPSAPANLTGTATSSTQVNLTWSGSTDNVGVTGYNILRNGAKIGTSATTSFADGTVSASSSYTYSVTAYDVAGNTSTQSNTISINTPAPPPTSNTITGKVSGVFTTSCCTYTRPIAGATLTLVKSTSAGYLTQQTTTSSSTGSYQFTGVGSGSFKVTATATGYVSKSMSFYLYPNTSVTRLISFNLTKQ